MLHEKILLEALYPVLDEQLLQGLGRALNHPPVHDEPLDVRRGQALFEFYQHLLEDAQEAPGAGLFAVGLARQEAKGLVGEAQVYAVGPEIHLLSKDDGAVLVFQNLVQAVLVQVVEHDVYREPSHEFRLEAEFDQVLGLDLL